MSTEEAKRAVANKLESALEDKFRRVVMGRLRGRTMKIVPFEKGAPDRLVILPPGIIHVVELKTDSGELSPAQRVWHAKALRCGYHVVTISGEAELMDWADRMAQLNK